MEPETTVAPENTMEPEATPQPETIVASEAAQTVTVTVKKGASSGSVSSRLQEAGLVEDAIKNPLPQGFSYVIIALL